MLCYEYRVYGTNDNVVDILDSMQRERYLSCSELLYTCSWHIKQHGIHECAERPESSNIPII